MKQEDQPFWKTKRLSEMTPEEWESLCDRCGRCCQIKFQDEDTGEIFFTNVVCRFLDIYHVRCKAYQERSRLVPTCVKVTEEVARSQKWLPETCAYRLLAEGKPLSWWHPLVSGSVKTVHQARISVRAKVVSEERINQEDLEDYIQD